MIEDLNDMRIGHRWAWTGVIVGAALSVAGNAWHVILSGQEVSLALRIIAGVIWPILLMIGIEVLMRVRWRNKVMDRSAQFLLTFPVAAVAAVVSYRHLNPLLLLADPSDRFSATIGPLAVDGLMLGCTLTLLVLRALTLPAEQGALTQDEWIDEQGALTPAGEVESLNSHIKVLTEQIDSLRRVQREQIETDGSAQESVLTDAQIWAGIGSEGSAPAPESVSAPPAPLPLPPVGRGDWSEQALQAAREERAEERAERSAPAGLEGAVRALIDPLRVDDFSVIAARNEVGMSTLRRYARVLRLLSEHGPEHPIDCKAEKVRPELVSIIRTHVEQATW